MQYRRMVALTVVMVGALGVTGCSRSGPVTSELPSGTVPVTRAGIPSTVGGPKALRSTTSQAVSTSPTGGAWKPFKVKGIPGRALVTRLNGASSGVTMKVFVWLPPQYDDPANAATRFPVVVAYPGGAGAGGAVWFSHGAPEAIAAGAKAGGSPFVLVEPQMQVSEGLDTECADLAGQPKIGTFLDTDVPHLIKTDFRVIGDKTGWGATGVSSGGYCAAAVAMRKPDLFSFAAPIDGYFHIDSNLAAGKTAAAKATSPFALATSAAPPITMHAWYGTGHNNGQLSKQRSIEFSKVVRPPTVYTAMEIPSGAHSWTTYRQIMPDVFSWFSGVLAKPTL